MVMDSFQPSAVVLQNGADSLNGDRLGTFNLTLRGKLFCNFFQNRYSSSHNFFDGFSQAFLLNYV